jgi:hypothetical protein
VRLLQLQCPDVEVVVICQRHGDPGAIPVQKYGSAKLAISGRVLTGHPEAIPVQKSGCRK